MLSELSDRLRAAAHRFKVRMRFSHPAKPVNSHRVVNPWSAVSIQPGLEACCQAVKAMTRQRFLSKEAPRLPLANCQMPGACRCRFRHHADRRSGPRRARDHGLPARHYTAPERRDAERGRRYTDI